MKVLKQTATKVNKKNVRDAARVRGIWSMTELARRIPCSVPSLYFAIERPTRYGRVYRRIKELTGL